MKMSLPSLQVEDGRGGWRTVIDDIGFPAGRPQTVTVDLTGKVADAADARPDRHVDEDLLGPDSRRHVGRPRRDDDRRRSIPRPRHCAWRGYSKEGSPDGREPFGYDYDTVSSDSPWKLFPGRYTREGDVRELLLATDDRFVIARSGDEIALTFDAASLASLPAGWTPHLPRLRRRLQQGDGPLFGESRRAGSDPLPRHDALSVRPVRAPAADRSRRPPTSSAITREWSLACCRRWSSRGRGKAHPNAGASARAH